MKYFHENKKGPQKRKPFEDVQENMLNEFTNIELKLLKMIEFDFNFDLPYDYVRVFRERWFTSEIEESIMSQCKAKDVMQVEAQINEFVIITKRVVVRSYI
jgi:hypothetical protein